MPADWAASSLTPAPKPRNGMLSQECLLKLFLLAAVGLAVSDASSMGLTL